LALNFLEELWNGWDERDELEGDCAAAVKLFIITRRIILMGVVVEVKDEVKDERAVIVGVEG
jgi:hypothetical protein